MGKTAGMTIDRGPWSAVDGPWSGRKLGEREKMQGWNRGICKKGYSMQKRNFDTKTKIDILKFMLENQINELNFRREREYRIFTWSSSILLALIGGLLVYRQESGPLLNSYGLLGRIIVSATVILLVFFSVAWQNRNNKYRGQNAQTIAHINKLFHCYDEGFYDPENNTPLFRKEWADYGKSHTKFKARFFHTNFVTATFLLGILAVAMIWVTR